MIDANDHHDMTLAVIMIECKETNLFGSDTSLTAYNYPKLISFELHGRAIDMGVLLVIVCRRLPLWLFLNNIFINSPEHNVLRVSYCDRSLSGYRPSVRESVNNYLKNLLWNRPTDFNETSQKQLLGVALSEYLKDLNSAKIPGCHGNRKKKT